MRLKCFALLLSLLLVTHASAAPAVLVVDLSDAYSRSTALAGLLADVDKELKRLADTLRPKRQQLQQTLRELKQQGASTRDEQLKVARQIAELDASSEAAEDHLADANQRAIAEVDAAIANVKTELRQSLGARAVLDIQETLYVRPDCACDVTDQLYARLNKRLPAVQLKIAQH